ncbi:MAG: hypothetical protein MHM6MM_004010 [Cercozoa sp. M6MM]
MGRRNVSELRPRSLFDVPALQQTLDEMGIKHMHLRSVHKHIFQSGQIDGVPASFEVPKRLTALLSNSDEYQLLTSKIKTRQDCTDTTKLLITLADGANVETVIMRHKNYTSVCVSSQVGCRMACRFCATGTLGLSGNLTCGEILEQLWHARQIEVSEGREAPRNVVFMGQGEPLDNYDAVCAAVHGMCESSMFGLAPKHVTVSTVGVVSKMRRMHLDMPAGINLALSLHAPTQELRERIVPTAQAYRLEDIMQALDEHLSTTKKVRAMIECIVIRDVNDSLDVAHKFGELLSPWASKLIVNLIPYNPTEVDDGFLPPADDSVREMQELLMSQYKMHVRVRKEMGQDIDGACGQLALKTTPTCQTMSVGDIEDLVRQLDQEERRTAKHRPLPRTSKMRLHRAAALRKKKQNQKEACGDCSCDKQEECCNERQQEMPVQIRVEPESSTWKWLIIGGAAAVILASAWINTD